MSWPVRTSLESGAVDLQADTGVTRENPFPEICAGSRCIDAAHNIAAWHDPTVKCYLDLSGQIWMVFYCYYHHYLLLLLLSSSSSSLLSSSSPSPWRCRLRQAVLSLQTHRRKASARQWQLFWDQIFFPLPCGCPKRAMVIKTDLCSYTE